MRKKDAHCQCPSCDREAEVVPWSKHAKPTCARCSILRCMKRVKAGYLPTHDPRYKPVDNRYTVLQGGKLCGHP